MTEFSTLLQSGASSAWLFLPSAVLLGALHGLEPGHSKTMMAAFIIAIRGSLLQAVLLGIAATLSHTAIVWAIALGGMYFGQQWNVEGIEPYLELASAAMILAVALWMIWRTWRHQHACFGHHDHGHHDHHHHAVEDLKRLDASGTSHPDPHELAHANDIRRRFAQRPVSTGQIIVFGLTGGVIPCPASITVLLLCLQLKRVALGATLVMGFSVGLAMTMIASGALAALSLRHVSRRWSGFGAIADKAPHVSGALILLVALFVGLQGVHGLQHAS